MRHTRPLLGIILASNIILHFFEHLMALVSLWVEHYDSSIKSKNNLKLKVLLSTAFVTAWFVSHKLQSDEIGWDRKI